MEISYLNFRGTTTDIQYSTAASLAFLVYDYTLTLYSEVELYWGHKWSLGTVLFIFNRYFGLSALIFDVWAISRTHKDQFCDNFLWWQGISSFTSVTSVEIILQARIYAVYDRNKKLFGALVVLSMLQVGLTLVLLGIAISGPSGIIGAPVIFLFPNPPISPDKLAIGGCFLVDAKGPYFVWIPALIFETILCLLMLYKAWGVYTDNWRNPLLVLLIRDSAIYFSTIFTVLLVNCLLWGVPKPTALLFAATSWSIALPCTVGSRILLNLREEYFKEMTAPSSSSTQQTVIGMSRLRRGHNREHH